MDPGSPRTPIGGGQQRPLGQGGPRVPLGQPAPRGPAIAPQGGAPQPQRVSLQQPQTAAQQQAAQHAAQQRPAQPGPSAQTVTGGLKPGMATANDPNLKPLERLFALMAQYDASDLHLKSNCAPIMRVKGEMKPMQYKALSSDEIYDLLRAITSPEDLKLYDETGDLDFAHRLPDAVGQRFRLNVFRDKRQNALVARRISAEIPTFEQLNLPVAPMRKIIEAEDGLIILAGVTGSGKSTTIAGMIDYLNVHHPLHIITVEDPIEYEFVNKRSFISQREIGSDCVDFKAAIRTLVRQDPDVILIGEMRDQETFDFGLTAAETGHLVFGTLHAGTVAQSIGRILGLFPPERHPQLRQGLQFNLRAIVCQKLLPSPKFGRVPINEILIATPIVKKILGEGEDKKLQGVVQGGGTDGMMTFDQNILTRYNAGEIAEEVALEYATNAEQLKLAMQGIVLGGAKGGIIG
jgi:twitching motility protein PilT